MILIIGHGLDAGYPATSPVEADCSRLVASGSMDPGVVVADVQHARDRLGAAGGRAGRVLVLRAQQAALVALAEDLVDHVARTPKTLL